MNLNELFKDHNLYHSEFQQDYLITYKAGGTVYGMYKQSLRELYKRYRGLKGIHFDKKEIEIDIEELNQSLSKCRSSRDPIKNKRARLELEKKRLQLKEIEKNKECTEKEFKRFLEQAITLKSQIGKLTKEKLERYELELWEYRLKSQMALDYISQSRLSKQTLEMLYSYPIDLRRKLISYNNKEKIQELITWYENKEMNVDIKLIKDKNLLE